MVENKFSLAFAFMVVVILSGCVIRAGESKDDRILGLERQVEDLGDELDEIKTYLIRLDEKLADLNITTEKEIAMVIDDQKFSNKFYGYKFKVVNVAWHDDDWNPQGAVISVAKPDSKTVQIKCTMGGFWGGKQLEKKCPWNNTLSDLDLELLEIWKEEDGTYAKLNVIKK